MDLFARELTEEQIKWLKGDNKELDRKVDDYLISNASEPITPKEVKHIRMCLRDITAELYDIYPAGDFGRAILSNSFSAVAGIADTINRRWLWLYNIFVCNNYPLVKLAEWRKKRGLR